MGHLVHLITGDESSWSCETEAREHMHETFLAVSHTRVLSDRIEAVKREINGRPPFAEKRGSASINEGEGDEEGDDGIYTYELLGEGSFGKVYKGGCSIVAATAIPKAQG